MTIETTFGEAKPTYYVFREGGQAPRHPHPSRFLAEKEADRLARKTPGATFHVVKLKKTLVNTAIGDAENERVARVKKQQHLCRLLAIGDNVKVAATHHAYPNMTGAIVAIDNETADDDVTTPTVWVYLSELEGKRRFQPGSLNVTGRPTRTYPADGGLKEPVRPFGAGFTIFDTIRESITGEKPRELRCGDLVAFMERGVERQGEIKQKLSIEKKGSEPETGYLVRDIIDNLIMPHPYRPGDLRLETKVEDRPESVSKACDGAAEGSPEAFGEMIGDLLGRLLVGSALRRMGLDPATGREPQDGKAGPIDKLHFPGKFLPLGSECWIITPGGSGFFAGNALKGRVVRHDDSDQRMVFCEIEDDHAPVRVNASRVFALDDERIHVMTL